MQCAKCGTTNRGGMKFCEECGARLLLPCPGCGEPTLAGKKFCGECGTPLITPSATPQTPDARLQTLNSSRLQTSDSGPIIYTPPHLANRILSGRTALEGERKIVTVLFADIKGSMDIMEGLDPEEAKGLVDPCLHLMMNAVHRLEGTVNRLLGDGIMALFGAPLALEDHPQRALYAALLLHEAGNRYAAELLERHGISLQIRVGITTGEVVVRTISNELYMDYSAVGHVVGLAGRGSWSREVAPARRTQADPARTWLLTHRGGSLRVRQDPCLSAADRDAQTLLPDQRSGRPENLPGEVGEQTRRR